uniref:Uncharacterized protein n=1 Tax=Nelumbo nucifera TaxID=4432 RepID=A0A822ZS04_NELNU|nr:TPA_asm: hypothetical protein HUJ06_017969 [Nelumbo nucifera]
MAVSLNYRSLTVEGDTKVIEGWLRNNSIGTWIYKYLSDYWRQSRTECYFSLDLERWEQFG